MTHTEVKIQCCSLICCMCRFHYVNWLSQPLLALTATTHTCQREWAEIRIKTATVHTVQSDLSLPMKVFTLRLPYYFLSILSATETVYTFLNVRWTFCLLACMRSCARHFNTDGKIWQNFFYYYSVKLNCH